MQHSYTSRNLFRALLGLGLSMVSVAASAQSSLTPIAITGTAAYTQDFDIMGATGTSYPAGWSGIRYAKGATATTTVNEVLSPVVVLDGSISGAVYNAGANAGTDRALGSLASGSTTPAFGAVFINNTGAAITRVNLAAQLEQWRSGSSNSVNETVVFEYSLNATNLESGTAATWTPVTALDLVELATASTTAGPLNGNDAANTKALSATLTGINWAPGTTMWIRWRDTDDAASDALLAVDNFSLSTGTTTSTRVAVNSSRVRVFPNPAADAVSIQIAGRATRAQVTVTDLTGRQVLTGTTGLDGSFSLRSLRAGQYIVLVQDGQELSSHKITKQ